MTPPSSSSASIDRKTLADTPIDRASDDGGSSSSRSSRSTPIAATLYSHRGSSVIGFRTIRGGIIVSRLVTSRSVTRRLTSATNPPMATFPVTFTRPPEPALPKTIVVVPVVGSRISRLSPSPSSSSERASIIGTISSSLILGDPVAGSTANSSSSNNPTRKAGRPVRKKVRKSTRSSSSSPSSSSSVVGYAGQAAPPSKTISSSSSSSPSTRLSLRKSFRRPRTVELKKIGTDAGSPMKSVVTAPTKGEEASSPDELDRSSGTPT
mmetsp:Transcript_20446/g.48089  ORF Transcript_20446/g.48089 Transcript_20446/m.48089 type:complete len:266 (+) Transcript_20446:2792-3589(+)